jgi:CRP-like cAMP-binding protein
MADNDRPEESDLTNGTHERRSRPGSRQWEHPTQRSFWHSLDAAERVALTAVAKERTFWAGTTLCRRDDLATEVIVIKSGWVKVTDETNGHEEIIAVRGAGDSVGERAVLRSASRTCSRY